jgi:hypothetical protein
MDSRRPAVRTPAGRFLSDVEFAPGGLAAAPGIGQDVRRGPPGAFLHLCAAGVAADLYQYVPTITVTADEDVSPTTFAEAAVPPVVLNYHDVTLSERGRGAHTQQT